MGMHDHENGSIDIVSDRSDEDENENGSIKSMEIMENDISEFLEDISIKSGLKHTQLHLHSSDTSDVGMYMYIYYYIVINIEK